MCCTARQSHTDAVRTKVALRIWSMGWCLLAMSMMCLVEPYGSVWASALAQRLFGADASTWKRPPPLFVPTLASPMHHCSTPGSPTEGERFIATLTHEERAALLRQKYYLLAKEDPDSPSRTGTGEASVKGFVRAVVIFDQPKVKAMQLICEPSTQSEFLKDLDTSVTIARQESVGELTQFALHFLFWDVDYWVQHWFYPEYSRVEWFLDTDHFTNDIKAMAGFWQLYTLSETQTIAEYGISVETGIPIPRSWKETIQRWKIPSAMKQCIRYIDSGGRYRKK